MSAAVGGRFYGCKRSRRWVRTKVIGGSRNASPEAAKLTRHACASDRASASAAQRRGQTSPPACRAAGWAVVLSKSSTIPARRLMRLRERDRPAAYRPVPGRNQSLYTSRYAAWGVLNTVERALARQSLRSSNAAPGASFPASVLNTDPCATCQVVEVLIAQHQTKDPLPNYCLDLMLDIVKRRAGRGSTWQTDAPARGRDPPGPAAVHLRST